MPVTPTNSSAREIHPAGEVDNMSGFRSQGDRELRDGRRSRYDYNPIAAPQALVFGQLPSNQTGVREAIGRRVMALD
jgi:hypothetical protein